MQAVFNTKGGRQGFNAEGQMGHFLSVSPVTAMYLEQSLPRAGDQLLHVLLMISHHAAQEYFGNFRRLPEAVVALVEEPTLYERLS